MGWNIFLASRHYFEPQEAGSRRTNVAAPLPPQRPVSVMNKITADYWTAEATQTQGFPAFALLLFQAVSQKHILQSHFQLIMKRQKQIFD